MDFPSSSITGQSGWRNTDTSTLVPYSGQFESVVNSHACQAPPCANPHVLNLACSPVGTSPPSGASDLLQQAMDLSMIASPPRSPYDYSGMFSPVTHSLSPANTPDYLSRLQRNPLLRDLHMLLTQECYGVQVPANLITTGWNLMQLPLMDSSSSAISGSQNVFLRHMQFQDKLLKVRINPHVSDDGLKVENEYSTNVGQIEMNRYYDLVSNMGNAALKTTMNSYYDKERIILVEKAEVDLDRLIVKADEIRNSIARTNVMQKKSSVETPVVRNMVKTFSAVPHLRFGTMDDSALENNPSVELSPLNDHNDFLLRIACESSQKSNGVQSDSRSHAQSNIEGLHLSEPSASSSPQQNSNLDKMMDTAAGMDHSKENTNPFSHLSCLKAHKVLSNDAVNILSMWYERHRQYPYPTDEEVKTLSDLTGVTEKQVKKWMANKRTRCFNTLSITGNKHPSKFKYEGRGKKRTHSEVGNDESSSSEPNSNGLTEESRRILNNWFDGHLENPYPLEEEKKQLAEQCGITLAQVKSWFANKRSRTNTARKQIPNYLIKNFPQFAPMVQVLGQQREQVHVTNKCQFSNFTNAMPFM
ncbi:hypothetical protein ACJMK2_000054 [Sinanodonta woodiana]|uniref:Homeobox domain-containing protein n=1 Tax=Sinanodonta woodiana TaxID=1069815 RepID=A0ABD3XN88_SINWO